MATKYAGRVLWVLLAVVLAFSGTAAVDLPEAKAAPSAIEQAASSQEDLSGINYWPFGRGSCWVSSWIVSESAINSMIRWRIFGASVHILPGNQVEVRWFGSNRVFDVGAENGQLYISPVGPQLARLVSAMSPGNTRYSRVDHRLYLVSLPRWVNPRIFGPCFTRLPTIVSITTFMYRAQLRYG